MPLTRRTFLQACSGLLAIPGAGLLSTPPEPEVGQVMTVTGPIDPAQMGLTLTHEHVASTFGLDPAVDPGYDEDAVASAVLPYLERARTLGCRTLVECTAAYFGRDPRLLRRLSEASGVQILTNTGYYGAADDRYVPAHAYAETTDQLAGRWLAEWRDGIDGTGIRPGFLKIGVDGGPLSEIDRKLVRAAARTHLQSGLTLAVHTGGSLEAAHEQLAVLRDEGVAPSAWIWVHAHQVEEAAPLVEAARAGAWVSLDGYKPEETPHFLAHLRALRAAGLLERVLLSHDGNTYPRKGAAPARPYTALLTDLLPALRENGFDASERILLTVDNPRRAFTVAVRRA